MQRLYRQLSEKDRRRYAAIEAEKLGHGGVNYISGLFGIDPKTIRRGLTEKEEGIGREFRARRDGLQPCTDRSARPRFSRRLTFTLLFRERYVQLP